MASDQLQHFKRSVSAGSPVYVRVPELCITSRLKVCDPVIALDAWRFTEDESTEDAWLPRYALVHTYAADIHACVAGAGPLPPKLPVQLCSEGQALVRCASESEDALRPLFTERRASAFSPVLAGTLCPVGLGIFHLRLHHGIASILLPSNLQLRTCLQGAEARMQRRGVPTHRHP